MSTITQTLTLAQLREDLERLASAHPGSYPTNVIEVIHQCGEITVDAENEEDALREELKNEEEALKESGKELKEESARADKAEEEAQALRAEMEQLHDGEETVSTYRERAKVAGAQKDVAYQQMREMRNAMVDAERECKALRQRKGVSAGVFKNIHAIMAFLSYVHHSSAQKDHVEQAAALLKEIHKP